MPAPSNQAQGTKLRDIGGYIYRTGELQLKSGTVEFKENGVVVLAYPRGSNMGSRFALTNYQGEAIADRTITAFGLKVGTYSWGSQPMELFDCGTPYIPPPPTPEELAAARARQELAARAAAAKAYQAQSNAVLHLQLLATNGEAWAQCDLGEHLFKGQGCETNRELAIYWLKKAADQGDIEASNHLARLKP